MVEPRVECLVLQRGKVLAALMALHLAEWTVEQMVH